MFPFWDLAISPIVRASGAKRVLEVGALRGETTELMLEMLGPESEVHVIDPVPVFDPTEHEKKFPGRYNFHRALSHEVLLDLPPMDVALIDGDHNWYTVYHELKMIEKVSVEHERPLPILILHDVGWPYGRRDLYYAPEQIPDEFRQPHAQRGMLPEVDELDPFGGLNPTMHNATHEGGERNGVMTALDDFVAELGRPVRRLLLPVYFGLAIVVEQSRLDERPDLVAVLDGLESSEGNAALAELAEKVRLDALIMQHGVYFNSERRLVDAAHRYLGILSGALLNEHYIEQEARIAYLLECVKNGAPAHVESFRDPQRQLTESVERIRRARTVGKLKDAEGVVPSHFPYTTMGRARLTHLQDCLETVRTEAVEGDLVDVGTGRGGAAIFMRGFLEGFGLDVPTVWVADEFRARPAGQAFEEHGANDPALGGTQMPHLLADLNSVREGFERFGLLDRRVRFLEGDIRATLPDAPIERIALLRLGDTVREDADEVLSSLYDRVAVGGFVVIDRYGSPKCQASVDAFRARHGITEPLEKVDFASVAWRKTEARSIPRREVELAPGTANVPLASPRGWVPVDLTVVAVFYNMKREAARTLHALSRAYQEEIDHLTYEVIVVENGSSPEQRLGAEYVESFGPEFRYVDMGPDAPSSPVPALNRGIREGKGISYALMIDGAHVVTPGLLHFGVMGLRAYEPAVVATQQWYVGPGQQADLVGEGYGQEFEDELFEKIEWPEDGYRLFDIGHFIGERDWFDGMWETNCLFVDRAQLEQSGCFDESFSMPGGGYANLDIFERLGAAPGVKVVTVLGEGSFHQVHGGTTTNLDGDEKRHLRLAEYSEHYTDKRGRPFRGNAKPVHYIGTMHPTAARTRARRRVSPNLFVGPAPKEPGGIPQEALPMPEGLWGEYTEAYWNTLKWRQITWMGHRLPKLPGDLFAYQEILHRVRPDWIVETGTGTGGRALFLASMCDLLDHGQVLSIDRVLDPKRPQHPRITYLEGPAHLRETADAATEIVGPTPNAVVILGSRGSSAKMSTEFHAYEWMVPKKSYLIVEDTIVNGHPVWGNFGVGPYEAVKGITETRGDFTSDRSLEKFGLTFNPTGFLRRIR